MAFCKYQNKNIYPEYFCKQRVEQDGFCFFHLDKPYLDLATNISFEEANKRKEISDKFYNEMLEYMSIVTDDTYRFVGFVFPFKDLRNPIFNKNVDFRCARFPQGFCFGNDIIFEGNAIFDEAEFNQVFFYSNIFKGYTSFRNTVFRGARGHFNAVKFEKEVNFTDSKFFINYFSFHNSIFKERADFINVKFDTTDEKLSISERKMLIDFSHTTFEKYCNFSDCEFLIKANFNDAKFKKNIGIFKTTFHQEFNFVGTEISEEARILGTCFNRIANFSSAKLSGEISFIGHKNRCFKSDVYFQKLKLSKDTILTFDEANLSQASFLYTNLEDIKFLDVDWFKKGQKRFLTQQRPQLWDEDRLDSSNKLYERVADNYRQLVNNYEKKRNFETAEQFHIGEMEIRRKRHKHSGINNNAWRWFRSWFNATGFYWLSSRYGTSYTQGMIILIILAFVVIPILFLLAGFQTSKEINSEHQKVIDFTLLSSPENVTTLSQLWDGYWAANSYTFSIITFQKDRFYVPIDDSLLSQMALYLAIFLLTTQGALVILAIRRQFKR